MSQGRPVVVPFYHVPSSTWSYVVSDAETGHAAIVDAVLDFDPKAARTGTESAGRILDHVREASLKVDWILETHAHADHLSAAHWLKARLGAPVAIGEGIRVVQQRFRTLFDLGEDFPVDGSQFDHLFADGERFAIGRLQARVLATPGHTSDSLSYLIGDALFVGDTLFMPDGGTARCDFPGGSAQLLYRSIQRLYALPDETRLFVCHDYQPNGREALCETTVAAQRLGNIHVRDGVSVEQFVQMREARDATLEMPTLILPAVQVNIRAGELPPPAANGTRYLKLPIDAL